MSAIPMTTSALPQRAHGAVTLRVLAALLGYPDDGLRGHLAEMRDLLRQERALPPARQLEVEALIGTLQAGDALDTQAAYVELFDRGRATSLHLFEHVHGDSRERGPAMIDLAQTYHGAGLFLNEGELPDYLPAMLEFISTQPQREARAFLGEIAHLLRMLFGALRQRDSAYASLAGALLELGGHKAEPVTPAAEPPLDESWAEPAAFDGCSTQGQAAPGRPQPVRVVGRNTNAQGATP